MPPEEVVMAATVVKGIVMAGGAGVGVGVEGVWVSAAGVCHSVGGGDGPGPLRHLLEHLRGCSSGCPACRRRRRRHVPRICAMCTPTVTGVDSREVEHTGDANDDDKDEGRRQKIREKTKRGEREREREGF